MTNQIKLHVGYVGKTSGGQRVEIIKSRDSEYFPFAGDNTETYTDRGTVLHEGAHDDDIIGPWVDAAAPDYNNGKWHGWNGGECPVHPKSRIDANNGCWAGFAAEIDWPSFHGGFRVVTPYVEPPKPREFWVWRDCKGRVNHVFTTKTAKDDVHFLAGDEIIHVREVLDT